jgi:hypothetical protein
VSPLNFANAGRRLNEPRTRSLDRGSFRMRRFRSTLPIGR